MIRLVVSPSFDASTGPRVLDRPQGGTELGLSCRLDVGDLLRDLERHLDHVVLAGLREDRDVLVDDLRRLVRQVLAALRKLHGDLHDGADEDVDVVARLDRPGDGPIVRDRQRDGAPRRGIGGEGLAGSEDLELPAEGRRRQEVREDRLTFQDVDARDQADDLVGGQEDPVRVGRVDRDLADGDIAGFDRLACRDEADGDDDRRRGGVAGAGVQLCLVDQEERRCTGDDGQDQPEEHDDPRAAAVVPVLHLHGSASPGVRPGGGRLWCRWSVPEG